MDCRVLYIGDGQSAQNRNITVLDILIFCTYMEVFDLEQTRGACSDGFSNHCIFVSPDYYYTKREGFYVELFLLCAFILE